jgi:hypothetical protein
MISPIPAVLLWVQEIGFDELRGAFILYGYDFREAFDWGYVEIPPDLFAFCNGERMSVRSVDVANVHRFSQGREWETTTPERMPPTPFLLTDAPMCRLVFQGEATLRPTAWSRDEIEAEFDELGFCSIPLASRDWIGVLQMKSDNYAIGNLLAYSCADLQLPPGEMIVSWAGEDEVAGQLVLP